MNAKIFTLSLLGSLLFWLTVVLIVVYIFFGGFAKADDIKIRGGLGYAQASIITPRDRDWETKANLTVIK